MDEIGVYLRGNSLTIVQRFFTIDALTGVSTPGDPSTITFTVIDPDGVETQYVYGVDGNVTRDDVGLYLLALAPPLPPGSYRYGCVGAGAIEAESDGTFTIQESGTDLPLYPTIAQYGPCNVWVDGHYVNEWTGAALGVGSSDYLLDPYAEFASQLMYELTARQFQGTCQRKVRPCRQACQCFGSGSLGGLGPWFWPSSYSAYWWGGWSWSNECGDTCGCGSESYIELAGYPVQRILQIKVNGTVLDPASYRLDGRRRIIRLADLSTTPATDQFWPACFPAGTLVVTDSGLKPIETIRAGESVLTHLGRWRRVLASRKTADSATLRLVGRGGTLCCTASHPILSANDEWTPAREMIGREWATPTSAEPLPIPLPLGWNHDDLPDNFWWFVGRWLGDGWTDETNRVTICCGTDEREVLLAQLRATGWKWRESGGDETAARWRFKSSALTTWLRAHFGTNAHTKGIPGWIFGAAEEIRRDLLAGYVSADGYIGSHVSGRGRPYTSITTVSRTLAVGTRLLAATLDHAAVVYAHSGGKHGAYRTNWPETAPNDPYSQVRSEQGYLWGRIRSVTVEEEIVPVYDLEVEDDHSFVAEGVIVHNCQDLSLPDTEPGTYSVTYEWGAPVPEAGKLAAAQLAVELWRASPGNGGECRLPNRVTRIVRAGVELDRVVPMAQMLREGMTGLGLVDAFIGMTNPQGAKMRSAVWSPDKDAFARQVGQDEYGT